MIKLFIPIIFIIISCNYNYNEKINTNAYEFKELFKTDDCSIYSMVFEPSSKTLFRLATAGNCDKMDSTILLTTLKRQLLEFHDKNKDYFIGKNIIIDVSQEFCPSDEEIIFAVGEITKRQKMKIIHNNDVNGRITITFI
jgi:hypothetical protein